MKKEVLQAFKNIYKDKRLLAVQLNGFNHSIFYDSGNAESEVQIDKYSLYTKMGTEDAKKFFKDLKLDHHHDFKHEPEELLFVTPKER